VNRSERDTRPKKTLLTENPTSFGRTAALINLTMNAVVHVTPTTI